MKRLTVVTALFAMGAAGLMATYPPQRSKPRTVRVAVFKVKGQQKGTPVKAFARPALLSHRTIVERLGPALKQANLVSTMEFTGTEYELSPSHLSEPGVADLNLYAPSYVSQEKAMLRDLKETKGRCIVRLRSAMPSTMVVIDVTADAKNLMVTHEGLSQTVDVIDHHTLIALTFSNPSYGESVEFRHVGGATWAFYSARVMVLQ